MLADQIIASDLRYLGDGQKKLVEAIREAHRFSLERDFTLAADELRSSKPSTFYSIHSILRLPFKICWMEAAYEDRKLLKQNPAAPIYDLQGNKSRIGVLIHELSPSRWLMHLFWNLRNRETEVSVLAMDVDFSGERSPDPEKSRLMRANTPGLSPYEQDILGRLERMCEVEGSIFHWSILNRLKGDPKGRQVAKATARQHLLEWSGEPDFWMAVVALMNSRNITETREATPLDKLNRARTRRGELPLMSFTTCDISNRVRERIRRDQAIADATGGVRVHFVRGHFKVRRGGIFWWSPFIRGDRHLGMVIKDYRVR